MGKSKSKANGKKVKSFEKQEPVAGSGLKALWSKIAILASIVVAVAAAIDPIHNLVLSYKEGKLFGGLSLYLGSEELERSEPTYIFFTAPPTTQGSAALLPVDTSVVNESKQPEKNVTLSIRYPKQSHREAIPEEFIKHSGAMQADDVMHEVNSNSDYTHSNYRIAFLSPEDRLGLSDASFIVPLDFDSNLPNGLDPLFGIDVDFTIYSESKRPQEWQVRYRGVQVNDADEMAWWIENRYGQHLAIELRKNLGFWSYLYRWAISQETVVYFFSPEFSYLQNTSIYTPLHWPKIYGARKFSPYVAELIFQ